MTPAEVLVAYKLVVGLLASAGLVYLLYLERFVVASRSFLTVTTAGLLLLVGLGPLVELVAPGLVHVVHGVAALLLVLGLYSPVRNDLRTDEWARLLVKDPEAIRSQADWMNPVDDRILELFHDADIVLTPSIIAYNIDYSREEVNRRLNVLCEHGFVERVKRGKYRVTPLGEQYLQGPLSEPGTVDWTAVPSGSNLLRRE